MTTIPGSSDVVRRIRPEGAARYPSIIEASLQSSSKSVSLSSLPSESEDCDLEEAAILDASDEYLRGRSARLNASPSMWIRWTPSLRRFMLLKD